MVGAPLRKLPVQLWDGQVTELPGGVGGAPALVPADAAASIQAGDLAEIYNMDLKVTGGERREQHPPSPAMGDNRSRVQSCSKSAQRCLECRDFPGGPGGEEGEIRTSPGPFKAPLHAFFRPPNNLGDRASQELSSKGRRDSQMRKPDLGSCPCPPWLYRVVVSPRSQLLAQCP